MTWLRILNLQWMVINMEKNFEYYLETVESSADRVKRVAEDHWVKNQKGIKQVVAHTIAKFENSEISFEDAVEEIMELFN